MAVADQAILDLDWSDQKKVDYFQTNWINTLKKQTVYTNADLTMIAGMTDDEANYYVLLNYMYYRNKKTRFKFATNITDNGKEYIGAVYYEEAHNYGNLWRLIYVTENGEIQTFSGNGANDPNTVPESWNKNTSFLGYLLVGD